MSRFLCHNNAQRSQKQNGDSAVTWANSAELKSVITKQRNYRGVYGSDAPDAKSIKLRFNKLLTTGSMLKHSSGVRRSLTEEKVEEIRQGFQRTLNKSIRHASRQFNVSTTSVHRVMHKRFRLYLYKVQIVSSTTIFFFPFVVAKYLREMLHSFGIHGCICVTVFFLLLICFLLSFFFCPTLYLTRGKKTIEDGPEEVYPTCYVENLLPFFRSLNRRGCAL
ncbi:hypothetical protein C0J52_10916 [Blattella germanica]|nr:hypothetical protein C0J52_10916 [Blattella germanica]